MQIILFFLYVFCKHNKNEEILLNTKEYNVIPQKHMRLHKRKYKEIKNLPFIQLTEEVKLENSNKRPFVFKRIFVHNNDLKSFMKKELKHIFPFLYENIDRKFNNRNIDLEKFRDLIFMKKRQFIRDNKKIVEYEIKEKYIPKHINVRSTKSSPFMLSFIMTFLISFLIIIIYLCIKNKSRLIEILNKENSHLKI